jgi:hypothetical protein
MTSLPIGATHHQSVFSFIHAGAFAPTSQMLPQTSAMRDPLLMSVNPDTGARKKKYGDFGDHCPHWHCSLSHHYQIRASMFAALSKLPA